MRSVTGILREAFGEPELPGSPDDLKFWLDRGKAIHAATALHDGPGLDWASVDERIAPYVRAYERFRRETGGEIVTVECDVVSRRHGYRGRLDRVLRGAALWPWWLVLDVKTTAWSPLVRLQLTGYALAWLETVEDAGDMAPPARRVARAAVALRKDGSWRSEVFDDAAGDMAGWLACVRGDARGVEAWKSRRGMR